MCCPYIKSCFEEHMCNQEYRKKKNNVVYQECSWITQIGGCNVCEKLCHESLYETITFQLIQFIEIAIHCSNKNCLHYYNAKEIQAIEERNPKDSH